MRPAEFPPEDIIAAGEALIASGRNVTGFALRQRVGGGNPNRLKQVWDEHIASKAAAEVVPVAELPVEVAEEVAAVTRSLTERISQLAAELNDKAVKASERRVAEIVRAAGEQREQAERELADASQTVEDLEAKLDAALADVASWKQELANAAEKFQSQAVELAQVRERLASAEKIALATADQHAGELARLNAALDAERQRHQNEAGELRAEIERQRNELATMKAEAHVADQTHQEQRKQSAQEISLQAERLTRIEGERDDARKDAASAREAAAKLRGQIEALEAQQARLTQALAERQVGGDTPRQASGDKPTKGSK